MSSIRPSLVILSEATPSDDERIALLAVRKDSYDQPHPRTTVPAFARPVKLRPSFRCRTRVFPPITVIGTEAIRDTFDDLCLQQAINSRTRSRRHRPRAQPGRPLRLRRAGRLRDGLADAHLSGPGRRRHQVLDEPAATRSAGGAVRRPPMRRALIDAIGERMPTGAGSGQRQRPEVAPCEARDSASASSIEGASRRRVPRARHPAGMGGSAAKTRRTSATTTRPTRSQVAARQARRARPHRASSPTRSSSSAPTAAATTSANARSCTSATTSARAQAREVFGLRDGASRSSRTAARAASATTWRRASSARCRGSSRTLGHPAAGQRPGAGLRPARHARRRTPTSTTWRWARTSRR